MQCSDTDAPCPDTFLGESLFDDPADWSEPPAAVSIRLATMRLHVPAVCAMPKPREVVRLKPLHDGDGRLKPVRD